MALFISRAYRRKDLYLQLVILPFYTSFLVRIYAWLFLLRYHYRRSTPAAASLPASTSAAVVGTDGGGAVGLVYG